MVWYSVCALPLRKGGRDLFPSKLAKTVKGKEIPNVKGQVELAYEDAKSAGGVKTDVKTATAAITFGF